MSIPITKLDTVGRTVRVASSRVALSDARAQVHVLAARALIRDLEEQKSHLVRREPRANQTPPPPPTDAAPSLAALSLHAGAGGAALVGGRRLVASRHRRRGPSETGDRLSLARCADRVCFPRVSSRTRRRNGSWSR
jgi:hypothetical protein